MARVLGIFIGLLGLTGVLFWASKVSTTPAAGTADVSTLAGEAVSGSALAIATPLFGGVSVDKNGAAKVTGKANPGDEITLLVNEKAAGVQTAGADGAWAFQVDVPSKGGEQILAVTSKNAKGETQIVGDRVKIAPPTKDGETPEVVLAAQNGSTTVLQRAGELGAPSQGITIEKAETGGEGKVSLAGKGDPGAKIFAFIGGESLGEAEIGPDGAWAIDGVAKATGSLRVEMRDADGKVKERNDLPFTVASADTAVTATGADAAKAEADAKAKAEADAKAAETAKAEADAKAKAEADAKAAETAKAEADAKAKAEADAKAAETAKAEADAKAKAEADAKAAETAKAEADAKAKAEADAKAAEIAKADAEKEAIMKAARDAAKKTVEDAAGKVAGAVNPGDVAGSLGKAVEAVTKATDGPKVRTANTRKTVRGSRKARAQAAHRQFVYRYVRMTETRTITVRRGDTLHRIAKRKLGNGERWTEIRRINAGSIRNPNLIVPGQKIRVQVVTMRKVAVPTKKWRHKKMRRPRR